LLALSDTRGVIAQMDAADMHAYGQRPISVRPASVEDAGALADLVSELGYPTSTEQMLRRLEAILSDDDYTTLVAERGREVAGFVGLRIGPLFEADEPYGQLMALSVSDRHRRRGVGTALIHAAEFLLKRRGVCAIVVTSANHRSDAHSFYEKVGFTCTGRRYGKRLDR
jgi:GNAT superfamily N-acetyltransferase